MNNFFRDYPVLVPLVAGCVTELMKLFINYVKHGTISWRDFFNTGGIPSGHSAFVGSITVTIFILKGLGSLEFALAFVFSMLVVFDAVKLRGEAGKHAILLNHLIAEKRLNERLGHTVFEVLTGIFLGAGLAFLMLF